MSSLSPRKGVIALITVIIVALFLFSIGVLLGVQGNTSISSGVMQNQSDKAEALAQTGIQDAEEKLDRNSSFTGSYTITETDGTISVSVASGTPILVNSTGTVTIGQNSIARSILAQVTVNADGKITNVTTTDQ